MIVKDIDWSILESDQRLTKQDILSAIFDKTNRIKSVGQNEFLILGMSSKGLLLGVVECNRKYTLTPIIFRSTSKQEAAFHAEWQPKRS